MEALERSIQSDEARAKAWNVEYLRKLEGLTRTTENEQLFKIADEFAMTEQETVESDMQLKEMLKQFREEDAERSMQDEIEK